MPCRAVLCRAVLRLSACLQGADHGVAAFVACRTQESTARRSSVDQGLSSFSVALHDDGGICSVSAHLSVLLSVHTRARAHLGQTERLAHVCCSRRRRRRRRPPSPAPALIANRLHANSQQLDEAAGAPVRGTGVTTSLPTPFPAQPISPPSRALWSSSYAITPCLPRIGCGL